MKGIVVYDTYYGNTKLVAEAIVAQVKADGHEAEIRSAKDKYPSPPQGDFLFVGSPVRMGRVTGRTKRFVKKLDRKAWQNKPIAVFTTIGLLPKEDAPEEKKKSVEKWTLGAALKLRDLAKEMEFNVVDKVLCIEVKDSKGPLVDTGVEQTKQFTHEFLQNVKK